MQSVVTLNYTAINLTLSTKYKFKVQARNSVGLRAYSNEVEILTA